MKRLYTFIALLFLSFYIGNAQESVKKHTVSSGETLLSISKTYNVTLFDLQKANPSAVDGVKIDDVLVIPESTIKTPTLESGSDPLKASEVSSSISHTVKAGESKYSISKRFGLTVSDLESQNPQILSGLNVGQVLEIFPSPTYVSEETPSKPMNKKGKTHQVVSGETLFAISSANGLTVDELVKANSKTISGDLKIGQILWIPGSDDDNASHNGDYVVKYGDTKFSLSRRFNTSVLELERKNPHIAKMLIVGQTINMPSTESNPTNTPIAQNETKPTLAVVMPTIEVKEAEKVVTSDQTPSKAPAQVLEKQEKKIVKHDLPSKEIVQKEKEVKTIISNVVPTKAITQKEKHEELAATDTHPEEAIEESSIADATNSSDRDYNLYKIQPNETVYGLAKKAGMTVPEFLELNPLLNKSVQIGTFIKMPNDNTASNPVSNIALNTEVLMLPKITAGFADLRTSAHTSTSKKLLFFLPFSEADYQNYARIDANFKNLSDDFKRSHLEFYKGANIAIDSIRKMNLNVDVTIVEAQSVNQTSKTMSLMQDHNIKDYDAIILPFYKSIEEEIAAFTADNNTPVITTTTIDNKKNTNNLYSALPSINQQRLKVLNYMMAKQGHIIVLNDVDRIESKAFITGQVPNADFVTIKKNGSFSEAELKSKLKKGQINYVIIDSERNSTFLNTTNALLSELSNYKLQLAVLDASLIPDDSNVSQKRYQILKMIFPSLIPAKSTESSKQFLSAYQKKHKILPSTNIMLGFDITIDSLLRLMQQQGFENSAINYITEYTQLKFDYEKNTLGGYSNEGIYILQYDPDAQIRDAN
ncbi:MAG: LysM peptidoglycan-binding domain-containing protein [Gelidibacter sp.]